jgi:hypothetical protein
MTGTAYEPLVFLDTNTMHFLKLFLSFARKNDLAPYGSKTDDPVELFKKINGPRGKTLQSFKQGQDILELLRGRKATGFRIEYSPITHFELVCGLLRGKAIENAAKEAIPFRMWSRFDEHEIFHRLDDAAYAAVRDETQGLSALFDAAGIPAAQTDPTTVEEIWEMTQQLLQFIFMDLGDSIVYASSLLAMADELVSCDEYLRSTANKISNPGGIADPDEKTYFQVVHARLADVISRMVLIEASEVLFPAGTKP